MNLQPVVSGVNYYMKKQFQLAKKDLITKNKEKTW